MKDKIATRCLKILKETTDFANKHSSTKPKTKEEMINEIIHGPFYKLK